MSEWKPSTWGEVSELHYGRALREYKGNKGLTQVFGTNGPIGWSDIPPLGQGPRPILGRKGAYRGVHLASGAFWVIDTAFWLEPGPALDPLFAYYAALGVDINSMDSGSALPSLNRDHFYAVPLLLPPLPEQQRIAGVLGAFDDLIETNRALADRQERLARTLPLQACGQVRLRQVATLPKLKQRRPMGMVDHFSIPAFDEGRLPRHESGETILSGKYALVEPSVLISRLNPSTARTWMAYPGDRDAVCSPEFVVAIGAPGVTAEDVWAVASGRDFWNQMQGSVGGTTNSRQRVDKAAVPEIMVPDVRALAPSVRAAVTALVRGAHEVRAEVAELVKQRDELLPLLMSGKVRVSDLEEAT